MRVFVAGASGAIGTRLVPQLIDRGHEVMRVRAQTYDPSDRTKARLTSAAGEFARAHLRTEGVVPPGDPVDCCAAYLNS